MKRSILFISAILFLIAVGVACASAFLGTVSAVDGDKGSLAVISDKDMKEYRFECDKGVIPGDVSIGGRVSVKFTEEGNIKKATRVRKVPVGC